MSTQSQCNKINLTHIEKKFYMLVSLLIPPPISITKMNLKRKCNFLKQIYNAHKTFLCDVRLLGAKGGPEGMLAPLLDSPFPHYKLNTSTNDGISDSTSKNLTSLPPTKAKTKGKTKTKTKTRQLNQATLV